MVISTHMKEIGQELFQSKNHRESLTGISISTAIGIFSIFLLLLMRVLGCGAMNIFSFLFSFDCRIADLEKLRFI